MASNSESESELPPASQREWKPWQQLINRNKHINKYAIEKRVFTGEDEDSDTDISDMSISNSEEEKTQPAQQESSSFKLKEPSSFRLREYQKELAEKALEGKNTIICAPTGSGKTWVAIHIIKEHMKKMDSEGSPKKVAFMAITVPLVMQQYDLLCKFLPNYKITQITGQSNNNRNLDLLFPEYDIITMTPMILVNHLQTKKLEDIGQFSLIILDECHHTQKNEPYNALMFHYHKAKTHFNRTAVPLPQIVGLTASIGTDKSNDVKEAKEKIAEICSNLDCLDLSTVQRNIIELKKNSRLPAESFVELTERETDDFIKKIQEIMKVFEDSIDYHSGQIHNISEGYTNFGLDALITALDKPRVQTIYKKSKPLDKKKPKYVHWVKTVMKNAKGTPIHDIFKETKLRSHIRSVIIISEYLVEFSLALQAYDLVEMRDVLSSLEKELKHFKESEETSWEGKKLYRYFEELQDFITEPNRPNENPNLKHVADALKQHLKKGKESRGIVFVKTRAMTEALVLWLERCGDTELSDLRPLAFTGCRAPETRGGMKRNQQEEIMSLFRSGEVRLLIATSVAEEGIDIPECNLVVLYNYVGNEVTTVQTRGRCRAHGGVSVLLAMKDTIEKERDNKRRVELMDKAVQKVQRMSDRVAFEQCIKEKQRKFLDEKLTEEKHQKQDLQNKPFVMICPMCRNVTVYSSSVRTIYGKHRVCVDRSFLDKVEFAWEDECRQIDELLFVGKVTCRGQVETGDVCGNKLGTMISHRKCPFLTLKAEAFAIYINQNIRMKICKKWNKVPYVVEELSETDVNRYLDNNRGLTMMEQLSRNNQSDTNLPPPVIAEPQLDIYIDWDKVREEIKQYFDSTSAPSSKISQFKPKSSVSTMSSMKMSEEPSTSSSSVSSMNMDEAPSEAED